MICFQIQMRFNLSATMALSRGLDEKHIKLFIVGMTVGCIWYVFDYDISFLVGLIIGLLWSLIVVKISGIKSFES